jgi:hypothetical protein
MTTTTALNTTTTTADAVEIGDVIITLGKVTFNTPAVVTDVKRYNGKMVWFVTANGGFYPMAIVGPKTAAILAA